MFPERTEEIGEASRGLPSLFPLISQGSGLRYCISGAGLRQASASRPLQAPCPRPAQHRYHIGTRYRHLTFLTFFLVVGLTWAIADRSDLLSCSP